MYLSCKWSLNIKVLSIIDVVSSVNHMTDMWLTTYKIFEHQINKSELKGQTSSFKVFV